MQRHSAGSITVTFDQSDFQSLIPKGDYPFEDRSASSTPSHSSSRSIVDEIFAHFGYTRTDSQIRVKVLNDHTRGNSLVLVQDHVPTFVDEEDDQEEDDFEFLFQEDDALRLRPKLTISPCWSGLDVPSGRTSTSTISNATTVNRMEYESLARENAILRKDLEALREKNIELAAENGLLKSALDAAIKSKEMMTIAVSDAFNHVRDKFYDAVF